MKITMLGGLAAMVLFGAASGVQAQQAQAPDMLPSRGPVRPFLGLGLTAGGDKIATLVYTNGSTSSVRAGELLDLYGGVDYRFAAPFSVQASIGYHFTGAAARNGNIKFDRIPIEVLGYFHASPAIRVGGGVRFVQDARVSGSGIASNVDANLGSTTGAVIEGEYLFGRTQSVGLKLRYVDEKYKISFSDGTSHSIDGSHVGLMASFYF